VSGLIADIADKYAAQMEPNDTPFERSLILRQALEELAAELENDTCQS